MEENQKQMYFDISQKILAQIKINLQFNKDNLLEIFFLLRNSKQVFEQYDYLEDNKDFISLQATCQEGSTKFALQIFKSLYEDEDYANRSNPEMNDKRKKYIIEEIKDKNYWINVYFLQKFIDSKIYYEEDLNYLDESNFSSIKSISLQQNKNKQEDKKIINLLKQSFLNLQVIGVTYNYEDITTTEVSNFTQRIINYNNPQFLYISFWRCNIQQQAIQQLLVDIQGLKSLSETQIDNSGCLEIANNITKLKYLKCFSLFVWDRSIQQINKAITKINILKMRYLVTYSIFFK